MFVHWMCATRHYSKEPILQQGVYLIEFLEIIFKFLRITVIKINILVLIYIEPSSLYMLAFFMIELLRNTLFQLM